MIELFYTKPENISDNEISFDDFEEKHILQTLKKDINDKILVTDGRGNVYQSIIIRKKPRLLVAIKKKEKKPKPEIDISLGIGFIRPNRLDFIFEKATELGVGNFYLFRSQFSNYLSGNFTRYQKIMRQALKQSQRFYLPEINVFDSVQLFIEQTRHFNNKIAAIGSEHPSLLKNLNKMPIKDNDSVLLAIGPEGGFSEKEIEQLCENNFSPVSLGKNRLRAETAVIAGISVIQLHVY